MPIKSPLEKHLSSFEDFLSLPQPKVSFEFFPPKTPEGEAALWETVKALEPLKPTFVSVTYGAGGSTRERTHSTVKRIRQETKLEPAAHLTCVGAPRAEIDEIARSYWDAGIKHIVALRGDPPGGEKNFTPHPQGYRYSAELVKGLKDIANFEISVACFPETHPEAKSPEADLDYLKKKIDAGADRAITQYFFDTDIYLRFMERARKAGITVPIVPGIVLIANFKQLLKFSAMCGATVPPWIHKLLDGLDDAPEIRNHVSAIIAGEQCRVLREAGVEQFHFYTLNRPHLAQTVCRTLGIK